MMVYKKLTNFFKQISTLNEISSILEWDMATMMPSKSRASRIKQIEVLTQKKEKFLFILKNKNYLKKLTPPN